MKGLKFSFIFLIVLVKNISAQDTTNGSVILLGADPLTLHYSSIKVYVGTNKEPIDSALVEIRNNKSAVGMGSTDNQGNCTIKGLSVGVFSVIVKKKKYGTVQLFDIKTAEGKTVYINIELKPEKVKKKGVRLVPVK